MEVEERLLRRREVEKLIGFSRAWIYDHMAEGRFPLPVKVGSSVRWKQSSVQRWIAERPGVDR